MAKRGLAALLAASTLAAGHAHAQDRSQLPVPAPAFDGTVAENVLDAKGGTARPIRAPQGVPNVFLMMSDDVGFAMSSAFGGPVPTPNFERLATQGQRYNRFHTTGICSPSRAALLTGHNHHASGIGWLSDVPSPYPGYGGRILPETATIAQVLRLNGYSTAMFGKHHNTPSNERSEAGPFDAWPTGLGFDYFYGFVSGDIDQYSPTLFRGIQRADQTDAADGKLLDARLADDIIRWVHNQKAGAPGKPFFAYLAPGSTHAPHQAPPEYIARFKGAFDQGWDAMRAETFRRQITAGVVPRGTKLTTRPAEIPAWNTLNPAQKAFAARSMEVAAAQLVYQDEQIGRVLAELDRMGQLDNTLVAMVLGDNGASAEVGPNGSINELRAMRQDENEAWMLANTDRLGGPDTYGSYPAGWAWAMNTPLRWTKQYASMLGGIRNGMILSWPGHVEHPGAVCSRFAHLNDMAPTILAAANLPAPQTVYGVRQKPMDGQSLLGSLSVCDQTARRTQYFEIGGKIGLYHDGWFLSGDDGRVPWTDLPPGGERPAIKWSLYDLTKDFSQSADVAANEPARLQAMLALWKQEAKRNDVFPLDHRFAMARGASSLRGSGVKHFDFWGKDVSIPTTTEPVPILRSFTLKADLQLASATASGAVVAFGSKFGGWSLYLDHGKPAFVGARSTDPDEISRVVSDKALPQGTSTLFLRFAVEKIGGPAVVTVSADGAEFARVALPSSMLLAAGNGETLDIGRDLGVTVTDYHTPHGRIEGDIPHVSIDFD